jgi:hypothetical protein
MDLFSIYTWMDDNWGYHGVPLQGTPFTTQILRRTLPSGGRGTAHLVAFAVHRQASGGC